MKHQSRDPDAPNRRYARRMRREPTPAEMALWAAIRDRSLSRWKFRRQHPVGSYILDFFCPRLRLGIELDGAGHQDEAGAAGDAFRTAELRELGITLIRFENEEVIENEALVCRKILDTIRGIEEKRVR